MKYDVLPRRKLVFFQYLKFFYIDFTASSTDSYRRVEACTKSPQMGPLSRPQSRSRGRPVRASTRCECIISCEGEFSLGRRGYSATCSA